MDLFEAVRTRRSVRSFTAAPVTDEQIEQILDAGRWAPTGGNMQPWEFIVIRDPELKAQLVDATYVGYDRLTGRPQTWILGAPVLVFVGLNAKRSGARYGKEAVERGARLDCAACVENMLLAITALGLGGTWIVGYDSKLIAERLRLPPEVLPFSLIALGHPAKVPSAPYRLPLEDITEYR